MDNFDINKDLSKDELERINQELKRIGPASISMDEVFEEAVNLWLHDKRYRGLASDGVKAAFMVEELGLLKAFALLLADTAMSDIGIEEG